MWYDFVMLKELNSDFWAKYFKVYDVLNIIIPYQELLDTVIEELSVNDKDLVLDAGCGTGNLIVKLENKNIKVIGIDFSEEALEICKQKIKNAELKFHNLTEPLPFPDNYFDKIVCNNVLYAMVRTQRVSVLQELRRVLKKGGKLCIVNPERSEPLNIFKEHFSKSVNQNGLLKTFLEILRNINHLYRLSLYNQEIIRHSDNLFLSFEEKKELSKKSQFNIIKTMQVYANESLLFILEKSK